MHSSLVPLLASTAVWLLSSGVLKLCWGLIPSHFWFACFLASATGLLTSTWTRISDEQSRPQLNSSSRQSLGQL